MVKGCKVDKDMNVNLPVENQDVASIERNLEPRLKQAFDLCVAKTRGNIQRLADEPKSYALAVDGNYFVFPEGFYEIGNWTSSFFTGMALLAWRETEDECLDRKSTRLNSSHLGISYAVF